MDNLLRKAGLAVAAATLAALAACGGGGDSAPPVAPPAITPAAVTISGTVATGAAFTGAVITVFDSKGQVAGTSAPVAASGVYSVTLSMGAEAPYVVIASRTTAGGEVVSMVSVAESASVTHLNVTPVTHLIASRLSASGNPLKLAGEVAAGTVRPTAAAIAAVIADVKRILAPVLAATGTADADPLTTPFTADGAGYDRLLDSISIRISPSDPASANIEIGLKLTTVGDNIVPPVIQFTSSQPVGSITTSNLITANSVRGSSVSTYNLVDTGVSVMIDGLLKDLTACHALPLDSRVSGVSGPVSAGTAVTGTASAVIAPECKSVFHAGDPAAYLHNGQKVGRTAAGAGAFAGLFSNAATGSVFSQGRYEFTRNNGDVVFSYTSTDSAGGESSDTLVARREEDRLRLKGNLYAHPGGVAAHHQLRQFPTLNQSASNYLSSGYTLNIENIMNGANPTLNRVVVTTPAGNTVTLYPSTGSSFLVFKSGASFTATNYLRMASAYADTEMTASPATLEGSTTVVFSNPQRTDEQMVATAHQNVWTFNYFNFGNTGNTANATQYYKTRARALSIAELRQKSLAALVPAFVADIAAAANATTGAIDLDPADTIEISHGGGDGWSVPGGALPPGSVRVSGKSAGGVAFEDAAGVPPTARKVTVPCTTVSGGDVHCTSPEASTYAGGTLNGIQLFSRDSSGRAFSNFYATYKLTPP